MSPAQLSSKQTPVQLGDQVERAKSEAIANSDRKKEMVCVPDLKRLAPGKWVNDVIINSHLRGLALQGVGSAKRAYIFRSQLWHSLSSEDSLDLYDVTQE